MTTGLPFNHFAGFDVWRLLDLRARSTGGSPFFIWQPLDGEPTTWTYADLQQAAAATAVGLTRRGVRSGDRVLIHLENSPEFIVSWFACAAIGAVAVTTNTKAVRDELSYYASDAQVVGAITQPRFADLVASSAPQLGWLAVTTHDSGVPADVSDSSSSFASLAGDAGELRPYAAGPLDPMSVQYTSGTTSRPKGVLWTQANALWGAQVNAGHEGLRADDCQLAAMPLFHTNALAYTMLASLWVGSRFVLIPKWSSSRFWDIAMRHGCTWLSLMRHAISTLAASEPPAGHRLRMFGTGMCDLPFDAKYGAKTIGWWGMTETISHPIVGDPALPNRPASMGRPAPEYAVAVVREDGITPVEPEETGHLLVKGVPGLSMFACYLNQPEATAASFDEAGWFCTGDLVTPHADGHLTYRDRAKDMLKVGGENVAASEIERVISAVPGVRETAVVGRVDDALAQVPVAFVITDGRPCSADDVLRACWEKLAEFKVPRDVYFVSVLPRSSVNKVNKVVLRKAAVADSDRVAAQRQWSAEALLDPSGDAL
jgi:crotonobetaine/carnitine-CoA ligase